MRASAYAFPAAEYMLDYDHGAARVYAFARQQYGASLHVVEWAEATLRRLFCD